MTDYRTTYSWKESLDLGPHLVRLAEALPEHEQSGMVLQLHQIMLDLPARVAQDLVAETDTRTEILYRLNAAVELIDRVYPALDTAEVRKLLSALEARFAGDDFAEVIAAPVVAAPVVDEAESEVGPQAAVDATMGSTPAVSPVMTEPIAEAVAPTTVSISSAPAQTISITPSSDVVASDPATVNVQPDSLQ